jgi:hypothetical protein
LPSKEDAISSRIKDLKQEPHTESVGFVEFNL